jgi:hypothetical protein
MKTQSPPSASPQLERRYRRLLALYPKAYRCEHELEILSVLLASAAADQTRPRLMETLDLLRSAIVMRLRRTTLPTDWEYRHTRIMLPVRIVVGFWLTILTAILYGYGRGGMWGLLLIPAALLHFFLAWRLLRRLET